MPPRPGRASRPLFSGLRPVRADGLELTLGYRLRCVLLHGGRELCDAQVPLLIGTEPHGTAHQAGQPGPAQPAPTDSADPPPRLVFHRDKAERAASLLEPGLVYFVHRQALSYANTYPFHVQLATSSKQGQRLSRLANAIRAENQLRAALRGHGPPG